MKFDDENPYSRRYVEWTWLKILILILTGLAMVALVLHDFDR